MRFSVQTGARDDDASPTFVRPSDDEHPASAGRILREQFGLADQILVVSDDNPVECESASKSSTPIRIAVNTLAIAPDTPASA
jgi:hypothetical protein